MTRHVVISVNENPQYIFYTPLVIWAWKKFGWNPILFYTETNEYWRLACQYIDRHQMAWFHKLTPQPGYGTDTVAQVSRLYASCLYGRFDDFIMTSDADMLPLSDYWKDYDENKINIWGRDLTNFEHIPICYIGASRGLWNMIMGIGESMHHYNKLILRDLRKMEHAKSHDSVKKWICDQDWITTRIDEIKDDKKMFHRGTDPRTGYPVGRVDRSGWTLEHPQLIDCHMMRDIYLHPEKFAKTLLLLFKAFPGEDFSWFAKYTQEFEQIAKK